MLKHLQRRFVAIAMFALTFLVFCQLTTVNVVNIYQSDVEVKEILQIIVDNDGAFPNSYYTHDNDNNLFSPFGQLKINLETPYSTRYFSVKLRNNVITKVSTENIAAVTDKMAFEYVSKISQNGTGYGFIDVYRYLYASNGTDSIIVFVDFQKEMTETLTLATISSVVGLFCILAILFPVYWLSKRALAPVFHSIQKQKQFITDAGHELKTPIAIISADADVLKLCGGDSEWVDSIKNQTERMTKLVKNLVDLSKLDEVEKGRESLVFNISDAVFDAASNFETMAQAKNREFILDIAPDIKYKGNEGEIRQLISILCDNAMKYSNEGGTIKLSLCKGKNSRNIFIDMYNTCEHIDPSVTGRLFDRFYRTDASRARETGGYGIGLSIAKAVVERHKGRIRAISTDSKSIIFKISL